MIGAEFTDATEPGIYTWDLDEDLLYADTLVAALFGLDPAETVEGLPLESYLARMHPNDRPTVEH